MTSEALTKAEQERAYRLAHPQTAAQRARKAELQKARRAAIILTPEQREERRAKQRIISARYQQRHGQEIVARKQAKRLRLKAQAASASATARRQSNLAKMNANLLEFEIAIRRVVATAAEQGTLDRGSDWYGLSAKQILTAPLPHVSDKRYVTREAKA